MINAVNEQFSRFVSFAEEKVALGKTKAIATKGDIAAGGGTPLEERNINVAPKGDWVGNVWFRKDDAVAANNEVRELFKKTIIDMFGGEKQIPDSVKKAMLLKDYGCGKPLTARRILAVKAAIDDLNRIDVFDKTNDPKGELANKAYTAGYTRQDFGKINTAVNLLQKAQSWMTAADAVNEVITKGSAANRTMNAGRLYMKDANSFTFGYNFHKVDADNDVRNRELARENADTNSTDKLGFIARNLANKFHGILGDAEEMFTTVNPSEANANALDEIRTGLSSLESEFTEIAKELESCTLTDREQIHKKLFRNDKVTQFSQLVVNFAKAVKKEAETNPAMAELRQYVIALFNDMQDEYTALATTYKEAVGNDMYKEATKMLDNAVLSGRMCTRNNGLSIPKGVTDNLKTALTRDPFSTMKKIKAFCEQISKHGDEGLRFTEAHRADLRALFTKVIGGGPKAEKALTNLINRFETVFFSEWIVNPADAASAFSRPDHVVGYFKKNPEALSVFVPSFKLDGENAVNELKTAIKDTMLAELKESLKKTDDNTLLSLSSGIMPQSVREYNRGYVTFKGENIPPAKLGLKFTFTHADNPDRKGYAEFFATKFDANHKKMRQMVSFSCGMAIGFGGAIAAQFQSGGEKSHINGASFDELGDKGMFVTFADRAPEEHYNIDITDSGDVKITVTHIQKSKLTSLNYGDVNYQLRDITPNASPVSEGVKITATMTIKNASDAELGDKMPEFTIDDIRQEEI